MLNRTAEERYMTDTHFHALVDLMESMIHRAQFTPSELREAALLAAIRYEHRNPRPTMVRIEELEHRAAQALEERR